MQLCGFSLLIFWRADVPWGMTGPEATYLSSQTAHIEMLDISVLLKKTTKLNSQLSLFISSRRLKKKINLAAGGGPGSFGSLEGGGWGGRVIGLGDRSDSRRWGGERWLEARRCFPSSRGRQGTAPMGHAHPCSCTFQEVISSRWRGNPLIFHVGGYLSKDPSSREGETGRRRLA